MAANTISVIIGLLINIISSEQSKQLHMQVFLEESGGGKEYIVTRFPDFLILLFFKRKIHVIQLQNFYDYIK